MKALLISNLFPPYVMGGAEMAAHSLGVWMAAQGHQIHVLTSAPSPELAGVTTELGMTVERRYFPNIYQIYRASETRLWRKAVWHWRDHFNAESEQITTAAADQFAPEVIINHDLQGIGYNLLRAVGRTGVPCVQVVHDFGLLCLNMNLFRNGRNCATRHLPCRASAWLKQSYFESIRQLAFWFPTQALRRRYLPDLPSHAQEFFEFLPILFVPPSRPAPARADRARVEFLYAGQITPAKGVAFLLKVLASLVESGAPPFRLTLLGDGADFDGLRTEYAEATWVRFAGRVLPAEVGNHMLESDLLLVPSLWYENSPLVVLQAVQLGLPIFASETGGLPELVQAGHNGRLLPVGESAVWAEQLRAVLARPADLAQLRAGALQLRDRFHPDFVGREVIGKIEHFCQSAAPATREPLLSPP